MKKILIINNDLKIGGIQKSLINLLNNLDSEYDISLLLFNYPEEINELIPNNVKLIKSKKIFSILSKTKKELRTSKGLYLAKVFFVLVSKIFGKEITFKLLGIFQKKIKGYDTVISYSHGTPHKNLFGGSAEFAIYKTIAKEKICFIHCDYVESGTDNKFNRKMYRKFNKIACVSESVKNKFITVLPELTSKAYVVYNFHDKKVLNLANDNSIIYDSNYINLISVARLSIEKGLDRVIKAIYNSNRKDIRYHIVGSGPEQNNLQTLVKELKLEEQVFFFSETDNPYRYMKNCDYLVVPSYHEAAPLVFDEAKNLGLKIISTATLSAKEMISINEGIICENNDESINKVIFEIIKVKGENLMRIIDNKIQNNQFSKLLDDQGYE